jgi:uncharacterized damage-inducible protein DinB
MIPRGFWRLAMKRLILLLSLSVPVCVQGAEAPAPTLKSILLEQLRTTHNQKDWFVPASIALEGLTPEQASWKDEAGNHSIGQLAAHLLFWNRQQLAQLEGKPAAAPDSNEQTFNSFDAAKWSATLRELDEVLTGLERLVETADEATLRKSASAIAHIGTHNAYHIGQIVYIRRLRGTWDPDKGVK